MTTPHINHPDVAVIGVNTIMTRAEWSDGAWGHRWMHLSSLDHRVIDG